MIRPGAIVAFCACALIACQRDPGPAIDIADVRIIAAMPGSSAGVAYLSIRNNSDNAIEINAIRSPQFERVEIHETTIDAQGVARMTQLEQLAIPAGDTAEFRAGGMHLMLIDAKPDTAAGTPVTLEIDYNEGLLLVSATLQRRLPDE